MKIEKDTVTFEAPDADFVAKFGMQAAADMVLDFHCFHPQLPFLYDARQLAAFLSTSRQKLLYYARHTAAAYHLVTIPKRNGDVRILSVPDDTLRRWQRKICRDLLACRTAGHRLSEGRHSQRQRRAPCGQAVSPEAGYLRLFRQHLL